MDALLTLLRATHFPKQYRSQRVIGTATRAVQGMCLGQYRDFVRRRICPATRHTATHAALYQACGELLRNHDPDFTFTSIQINKNVMCEPHRDVYNDGDSYIIGLGDYSGGELVIEGIQHDIKNKFVKFNGSQQKHWTAPFEGERYTIIFFTLRPFNQSADT